MRVIALAALSLALAACSAPHAGVASQASAPATSTPNKGTPAVTTQDTRMSPDAAFKAAIHEGMSYGDFRQRVLALGWAPVKDPQCATHLTGESPDYCAANADLMLCRACTGIPEIHAYSSDGHSVSEFRHTATGRLVTVYGIGELQYWKDNGNDTGFGITAWEFKPAH